MLEWRVYALNGPALKQLYIPTTPDVRFKAHAWIETFGSHASKEAGSIFNMFLTPLQTAFGDVAGFPLLVLWFVVAIFLRKTFKNSIDNKKVVC